MMDPKRLIDEEATDFEATLLRAGRRDAISESGRQRVLAGLGVGAGILAGASATAAAMAPTGKLAGASVALFKYLGIGGVAALAIWGGVRAWESRAPAHHPGVLVEPAREVAEESERNEPPQAIAEVAPVPTVAAAPLATRPRSAQAREAREERAKDSLPRELGYLDRARRELSGGRPALALRVLDEYEGLFPNGRLGAEAAVLRIESLARAGDRAGVAAAGKDFLAKHPNGPYATRVRSLMGEPRPAAPP